LFGLLDSRKPKKKKEKRRPILRLVSGVEIKRGGGIFSSGESRVAVLARRGRSFFQGDTAEGKEKGRKMQFRCHGGKGVIESTLCVVEVAAGRSRQPLLLGDRDFGEKKAEKAQQVLSAYSLTRKIRARGNHHTRPQPI